MGVFFLERLGTPAGGFAFPGNRPMAGQVRDPAPSFARRPSTAGAAGRVVTALVASLAGFMRLSVKGAGSRALHSHAGAGRSIDQMPCALSRTGKAGKPGCGYSPESCMTSASPPVAATPAMQRGTVQVTGWPPRCLSLQPRFHRATMLRRHRFLGGVPTRCRGRRFVPGRGRPGGLR